MPEQIPGIILAGGKSERLGLDKRFITIHGISLLDRSILLLKEVTAPIIIVAADDEKLIQYDSFTISDIVKGIGPIGGIYTGLKHIKANAGLFIPCDMPLIQPALLKLLIKESVDYEIVLFKTPKDFQPLPGIYSKRCIRYLEDAINRNDLSLKSFIETVPLSVKFIPVSKEEIFLNINRQEDLLLVRKLLNG